MIEIKKVKNLIKNPLLIIPFLGRLGYLNWINDKTYLKLFAYSRFRKKIKFNNPKTFNDKLQWLKIYDRKTIYTDLVDKKKAKKIVGDLLGESYLIKTIKVFNRPEEIDLDLLPNRFVLKCTHDSGGVVICRDKKNFDKKFAVKKLNKHLKSNYYWGKREWPYKNINPQIIGEEYLEDDTNRYLTDYKFYCCQVIKRRNTNETIDFFDIDWNHMPFTGMRKLPNSNIKIPQPKYLNEMIFAAEHLSKNIPFVRVDFYHTENNVYFGEMTFYPQSGFGVIEPKEWNTKLGNLINLPEKRGV